MKQRLTRLSLVLAFALVVAGLIAWAQVRQDKAQTLSAMNTATGGKFGGPFTLTDHNGQRVTEKDLGQGYKLIYFGFTYCPAICPTELQKITQILNILGEDAEKITPVFITVDPERDTAETMKNYVAMFHPAFIGLTGTQEEIDQALKGYKVYAAKVDDPDMTEYTMDHSSYIYFIGPDDALISLFKTEDTAEDAAQLIRQRLDRDVSG